jgi:hypothetical protein
MGREWGGGKECPVRGDWPYSGLYSDSRLVATTVFRDFDGCQGSSWLVRRAGRQCSNIRTYPDAADLKQHCEKAPSSLSLLIPRRLDADKDVCLPPTVHHDSIDRTRQHDKAAQQASNLGRSRPSPDHRPLGGNSPSPSSGAGERGLGCQPYRQLSQRQTRLARIGRRQIDPAESSASELIRP